LIIAANMPLIWLVLVAAEMVSAMMVSVKSDSVVRMREVKE